MTNTSAETIARKSAEHHDQVGGGPAPQAAKRPRKKASPRSGHTAQVGQSKSAAARPKLAARVTKQDQLAALLLRDEGATLEQMIAATGWLPHTTRAALTGLRKKGYGIDSDKVDGIRTYRAVAPK